MSFYKYRSKIKKVLLAVLPGIIVAGLIFGANVYYDLDVPQLVVSEFQKIIGKLDVTATTTLATVSGSVGIATTTPTEVLTISGNVLATGNLTISGGQITGANAEQLLLGVTDNIVNVVRAATTYVVCDSSGNCAGSYNYIGGTGTPNYISKFTATSTLGNSIILDNGSLVSILGQLTTQATTTFSTSTGFVGIATTTPYSTEKLTVYGNIWGSGNIVISGTIDTGQGATKVYLMNQNLTSTSSPTFANLIVSGIATTTELRVTSTSTLGTVISGIWQGNIITTTYGGTGANLSAGAQGGIVYMGASSILGVSAAGTAGQPLLSGGTGAPTWGTLGTSYGGTGLTSYTAGDILYYSSGTALSKLAIGSANTVLTSSGSAPQWSSSLNLGGTLTVAGTTTISNLTQGSVLFAGPSGVISQDNANFFWDDTNNRLGIGTATPGAALDVDGNILLASGGSIDTRAAGSLIIGGSTQTGLTLGRAGVNTTINGGNIILGAQADATNEAVRADRTLTFTQESGGNVTITNSGTALDLTANRGWTLGWTGTLSLARGGTGAGLSPAAGGIVYSGTSAFAISATGTAGQALISGGTGAPSWFNPTAGSVIFAGSGGALSQDNANFFWNDASNQLGIGTTSTNEKLTIEGVLSLGETTAPASTTNYGKLYVKSVDSRLYFLNDSGTEYDLTAGGIGGTISTGQVAFGTDANTIGGDNNLFWDNTNKRLGIGTTTPAYTLDVNGTLRSSATTTLVTGGGFVGIATTTPYSTEKLTVYGNIWGSGNILLQSGSYNLTLTPATLGANRTITFPDLSGTVAVSSTAPITLSSTGVIGLTTPLAISYGGTATSSIGSAGSVVYSNGSYYAFTAVGTAGQPLLSGGTGVPTWGTLGTSYGGTGLTSIGTANQVLGVNSDATALEYKTISGTASEIDIAFAAGSATIGIVDPLALSKGGTGANLSAVSGGIIYSGASAFAISATGTSGQALISGGTEAPTWFAPTAGSVIFAGTGGVLAQNNANFFWDDTNNRLGIGTATPSVKLHVYESALDKSGVLINIATTSASYYSLDVQSGGTSRFYVRADGNVGIGTTTPARRLEVLDSSGNSQLRLTYSGSTSTDFFVTSTGALIIDPSDASDNVKIGPTGTGKLTSGTLDPLYNIGGKTYATYVPGMAGGVKEETTGVIRVDKKPEGKDYYQAEIDFNNLEEGSDLWLFSKVTNLRKNIDRLSVLLTSAGRGHVWYQVDPENFKLYFYSEKLTTISYRLTAPRFDWEKWPNMPENETGGMVVNEDDSAVGQSELYKFNEENNLLSVREDESGKIVQIDPISLKSGLASFGIMINEYGYLEVDTLRAKKVIAEEFEMRDKTTSETYCVWIEDGEWKKAKGECPATSTGSGEVGSQIFYYDGDRDGFGSSGNFIEGSQLEGYVPNRDDCNDSNPEVNPGATEICGDQIDNNCNGLVDEGCQVTTAEATTTESTTTEPTCTPNWQCTDWQPLPETIACGETFTQTRTCTDLNNCGTEEGKPRETQETTGTKNCSTATTTTPIEESATSTQPL